MTPLIWPSCCGPPRPQCSPRMPRPRRPSGIGDRRASAQPEHGDYATNLALQVGKKVGANPCELAGWLADALAEAPGIAAAEVAGPGFGQPRLDAAGRTSWSRTLSPRAPPMARPRI